MRRLFAGLIVCTLVLPGRSLGQATGAAPVSSSCSDRSGVIRGRAVGIDLSDTLQIVIDTDTGLVKLSALPTQIANLVRGDIVSFRYRDYGGELWIELDPPGTPGSPQISPESFGQMGVVSGPITGLDKSHGQVFLHGRAFRTHPQMLENLLPGAFVDVTYVQFGNAYGAVSIQPSNPGCPPRIPGTTPAQSQPGQAPP
ncbi:MAG TPA: hypothetical protein DFS52_14590 [Myxococcales bacterium]|jgi:hypothetical protein|nr:hypothetical protein [Myxococcales bacterium]